MSKGLTIKTKGSKRLIAAMGGIENACQTEILEVAARVGSQIIEGDARRRAPRASGKLAASIKSETVEITRDRVLARVVAPVFYARFPEYGTINQPAQPFMRPALYSNRRRVLATIRGVMGRILRARFNR